MRIEHKVQRLMTSIGLFEQKKKTERVCMINGRLVPRLKRQLESIIKQANNIDIKKL